MLELLQVTVRHARRTLSHEKAHLRHFFRHLWKVSLGENYDTKMMMKTMMAIQVFLFYILHGSRPWVEHAVKDALLILQKVIMQNYTLII